MPIEHNILPPLHKSKIRYYPSLGSTNTEARRLAEEGATGGTVVLADAQSAGKGRRGRAWHSPPGRGIYFSTVLRPPKICPAAAAPVTLAAAAALAGSLRKTTGLEITVKWPNDLLIGAKKMGGILTEAKTNRQTLLYIVLGVGLNVNHRAGDFPPELQECACSLYLESKRCFDRTALFLTILEELQRSLDLFFREGFAPFQSLWEKMSATVGNRVELSVQGHKVRGIAVSLDAEGALLVEDDRGRRHRVLCGEII